MNLALILLGKALSLFFNVFNLGSGSTWPGHIALNVNKDFVKQNLKNNKTKIIIIAGTNGKTTTGKLITTILTEEDRSVIQNEAGANLLNGLASTIIKGSTILGVFKKDYLIFEADEYSLPIILDQIIPDYLIFLNLFRDQLDRYGEIDSIAKKWHLSVSNLPKSTKLILNADDPQIAYLSKNTKAKTLFFGLAQKSENKIEHGADSIHCPRCKNELNFKKVFFSHLGDWECKNCGLKRPKTEISDFPLYPLPGTYNKYNVLASVLFAREENIDEDRIKKSLENFVPAFGRQEKIIYNGRIVHLFLSKNPTSFNQSLQTIKNLGGKNLLFLLNDRIPDGLDISWIWDINLEEVLDSFKSIIVSGDRSYDMALRMKFAQDKPISKLEVEEDLQKALEMSLEKLRNDETLYVLPNYSAMLDLRKLLIGRKIL